MKLDINSPVPLYYQLENIIRERIDKGIYGTDEKIPSERVLSEEFMISRMTISKAITNLVDEGVLYRKRGQGTFVAKPKLNFFPGLRGFTEIIEEKGMKPSSKVIFQELVVPDMSISEKLGLQEWEKVIHTRRLRLADDQIINLEESFIPFKICPKLLDVDLSVESVYKMLSDEGFKPTKAYEEIEAMLIDDYLKDVLSVKENVPVLKRCRLTKSKEMLVEYSENYYRCDIYKMGIFIDT